MKATILVLCCVFMASMRVEAQSVFAQDTIQRFEIYFSQTNWDTLMDELKATTDDYLMADSVIINGTVLDSVGVKYKGNSSYNAEAKKNSFTFDLDEFKDHVYQGLTKYKLHNLYMDPSMIREPLAYKLLREYMVAPRSNFAEVYVNGAYHGLYSNTEDVSKTFVSERFSSKKSNTFIKCSPPITPGPNVKANLRYLGEDSSLYENYYEMESDTGWNELVRITDVMSNRPESIDSFLNLDAALWMLAFDHGTLNLDSYIGAFSQNYFLYRENNGQYTPICWDMNMSFGGFPFIGSNNTSLGALSIAQMKTLPTTVHSADQYWPLIKAVHENATWRRMFLAHLRTFVNEQLGSQSYAEIAQQMHDLVDASVKRDTNSAFTYEQFQNSFASDVNVGSYSIPGILSLMTDRISYLQSTSELLAATPEFGTPYIQAVPIPEDVAVSVAVSGNNVGKVLIFVRASTNARYRPTEMVDDGEHMDGAAGDGIYGAIVNAMPNAGQYYLYAENANAGIFWPERASRAPQTISITTSVSEDVEGGEQSPYPNPASDHVMLPSSAFGGRIIDMHGNTVMQLPLNADTAVSPFRPFAISALQPGLYRVVNGAKSWPLVVVR